MNACPHCGSVAHTVDHLRNPLCSHCNSFGNSLLGGLDAPHAAGGYGGGGYGGGGYGGGGAPLRCQMGHEIAPGASYCAQGHPIALDAMPFAGDGYGQQPQQGYPPPQQQGYNPGGFQPAPPAPGGYNPGGYDQFNPGGGGFGAPPPPQQQYAPQPPQQQQYAPQPPQQPQYAPPPPMQQPGMPGQPPQAYEPAPAQPAQLPPNAVRGFLVAFQSNPAGDYWVLTGGRHTIGRANSGEQVDVPLADATISSKHAAISVDVGAGVITVEDRGSTNGTYVNEEHIGYSGRRDLRDGDKVRFGGFTTIVKIIAR
jgi:pSer/pThr/pTyr-binding forkhead associated (FHA) protein